MAVVVLIAGCSTTPQPAAQSSPTSSQRPAALQGDLPVFEYGLNDAAGIPQQVGGFLHFPGGLFRRDPSAGMVLDYTGDRTFHLWRTTVQPYLLGLSDGGWGETSYDPVVGRWLPVARKQLSDDGLRYAYRELLSGDPNALGDQPPADVRLHVVDIRSGLDRVVSDNGNLLYNIVGFAQQDIFLAGCDGFGCWGPLSRVEITTGKLTRVSDRVGRWVISGRVAWVAQCSSANGPIGCLGPSPGPSQVVRIDLASGNEEVWYRESGSESGIDLIGVDDAGVPLVKSTSVGESVLIRVRAPGQAERLFSVPADKFNSGSGFEAPIVADRLGTWVYVNDQGSGLGQAPGISQGMYLDAKATGVRKVSDFAGVPVGPLRTL